MNTLKNTMANVITCTYQALLYIEWIDLSGEVNWMKSIATSKLSKLTATQDPSVTLKHGEMFAVCESIQNISMEQE